jgi:hypothetical protein
MVCAIMFNVLRALVVACSIQSISMFHVLHSTHPRIICISLYSKFARNGGCYLKNVAFADGSKTDEEVLSAALSKCDSMSECMYASCGYDDLICGGNCYSCTLQMAYDPLLSDEQKPKFFCDLRWAMYAKKEASGYCGCNKICSYVNPLVDTANKVDGEFITLPCSCASS